MKMKFTDLAEISEGNNLQKIISIVFGNEQMKQNKIVDENNINVVMKLQ